MIALLLFACDAPPAELVEPVLNPLLSIDRSGDRTPFEGTVTASRKAGGYRYVAVDGRWVVGLDKALAVGDRVTVSPVGVAHDFTSGRTGDHYDELVFGVVSKSRP